LLNLLKRNNMATVKKIKKAQDGMAFKMKKDAREGKEMVSKIKEANKKADSTNRKTGMNFDKKGFDSLPKLPMKKYKAGGSLSGLDASNKRVGPVDPKGAYTKVQKRTLAGAKGKATLKKDKELGATKMKNGGPVKKCKYGCK